MIAVTKACLNCSKHIRGRSDKKFCNDHCRNTYNNRRNSDSNSYIRSINFYLRKNRRILEGCLLSRQTARTTKSKLNGKGFRFKYFTHTYTNSKGKLFHYCYEYGYLVLEKENVMIIRKQKSEEDEE